MRTVARPSVPPRDIGAITDFDLRMRQPNVAARTAGRIDPTVDRVRESLVGRR